MILLIASLVEADTPTSVCSCMHCYTIYLIITINFSKVPYYNNKGYHANVFLVTYVQFTFKLIQCSSQGYHASVTIMNSITYEVKQMT